MANTSADSKLKSALSDESSEDEMETGNDDLGLSLNKPNLGPKLKLLVLYLGGLLVDRVHVKQKANLRGRRADLVCGNLLVFKRPFCTEFPTFCFERFNVALWSSAREIAIPTFFTVLVVQSTSSPLLSVELSLHFEFMRDNIEGVSDDITGGARNKFLFVRGQRQCTATGFTCLHKDDKPLLLNELKRIWETKFDKRLYSASGPKGEWRAYLDGVADADDVPSYVKDHRIRQPAITPSHADWGYYSKIARRFAKKDEGAGSSSK